MSHSYFFVEEAFLCVRNSHTLKDMSFKKCNLHHYQILKLIPTLRIQDTASEWADSRETALTEELDSHLRSHRPRAGRIEEETRMGRCVEEAGLGG